MRTLVSLLSKFVKLFNRHCITNIWSPSATLQYEKYWVKELYAFVHDDLMILEFTAYVVNFSWRRYLRTSVQSAFSPSLRWWPSTAWAATASPSRPSGWRSRCAESTSRSSLTTTSRPACLSSCRGWDYAAPIGGIVNHPTIIQWDWKGVEKEEKLYSKTCIKAQRLSHSTSATSRFCPKSNIIYVPSQLVLPEINRSKPTNQRSRF